MRKNAIRIINAETSMAYFRCTSCRSLAPAHQQLSACGPAKVPGTAQEMRVGEVVLWTSCHGGLENPPELGHRKRVGYQMQMHNRATWARRQQAVWTTANGGGCTEFRILPLDSRRHHTQTTRSRIRVGAGSSRVSTSLNIRSDVRFLASTSRFACAACSLIPQCHTRRLLRERDGHRFRFRLPPDVR